MKDISAAAADVAAADRMESGVGGTVAVRSDYIDDAAASMTDETSPSRQRRTSSATIDEEGGGAQPHTIEQDARRHRHRSNNTSNNKEQLSNQVLCTLTIAAGVIVIGATASACILAFGLTSSRNDQRNRFERVAKDLVAQFRSALADYVTAGLWLHQATIRPETTHQEFRLLYEYLRSSGLVVSSVALLRNITHEERPAAENVTSAYLADQYPQATYIGFKGFQLEDVGTVTRPPGPRDEAPFYFPMRLIEPLEDLIIRDSLDLDQYSLPFSREAIDIALTTWQPSMTRRLQLDPALIEGDVTTTIMNWLILMHPGVPASGPYNGQPKDVSAIQVAMSSLIERSYLNVSSNEEVSIYIYDSTATSTDMTSEDPPTFLGGARLVGQRAQGEGRVILCNETPLSDVRVPKNGFSIRQTLQITSRNWTFVIASEEGSFVADSTFVILAAVLIFAASLGLAVWMWTNLRRTRKFDEVQMAVKAEKTALLVETAKKNRERQLNDWLAHEIRNPLSAALSACSFVSATLRQKAPLTNGDAQKEAVEDLGIISHSLQFINDLLRNMLDLHRASSSRLKCDMVPTEIRRDIFEPASAMLYNRGVDFEVIINCPEGLVIKSDKLRLLQVILNLGRNSVKFVTRGFIRLRADVIDNEVFLYVEDSGPGIPLEKRGKLFTKFQESSDSLCQGTGVGLSLCEKLMQLLGGKIWLDDDYDSGIEGCRGTRFVLVLHTPPITLEETETEAKTSNASGVDIPSLPDSLSVLFVDDDVILRRLFSRTIRKNLPKWDVDEAASGEMALQLVESKHYDIIFMDQYMSSTAKTMLGTEATRELRACGVTDTFICGLSANEMERSFVEYGADAFSLKPFPCQEGPLKKELHRILNIRDDPIKH